MGRLIELFPEQRPDRRPLGKILADFLGAAKRQLEAFSVALSLVNGCMQFYVDF